MQEKNIKTVYNLALKAINMVGCSKEDLERICWILVHEHCHGFKPSEYDIREIDETLYISVLEEAKRRGCLEK